MLSVQPLLHSYAVMSDSSYEKQSHYESAQNRARNSFGYREVAMSHSPAYSRDSDCARPPANPIHYGGYSRELSDVERVVSRNNCHKIPDSVLAQWSQPTGSHAPAYRPLTSVMEESYTPPHFSHSDDRRKPPQIVDQGGGHSFDFEGMKPTSLGASPFNSEYTNPSFLGALSLVISSPLLPAGNAVSGKERRLTSGSATISNSFGDSSCQTERPAFSAAPSVSQIPSRSTKEKQHMCTECGKRFSQQAGLRIHFRIHTGEKPFACTECGKRFRQPSGLIVHRRTHTGERPFECTVCGKQFRQPSNLNVHLKTHTGENPYRCHPCNEVFQNSGALGSHMKTVHSRRTSYSFTGLII